MSLRTADDDPVRPSLDDVQIEVRILLLGRSEGAVALHVRLRDSDREVLVAAVLVEGREPPGFLVEAGQHAMQRERRVRADLAHERDKRCAVRRRRLD